MKQLTSAQKLIKAYKKIAKVEMTKAKELRALKEIVELEKKGRKFSLADIKDYFEMNL